MYNNIGGIRGATGVYKDIGGVQGPLGACSWYQECTGGIRCIKWVSGVYLNLCVPQPLIKLSRYTSSTSVVKLVLDFFPIDFTYTLFR